MDIDIDAERAATPGCATVNHLNNAGAALPTSATLQAVIGHLQLEAERGGYEAAALVSDRLGAAALVGGPIDRRRPGRRGDHRVRHPGMDQSPVGIRLGRRSGPRPGAGGRPDLLRQPLPEPAPGVRADRRLHRGGAQHRGRHHRPRGPGHHARLGAGGAGLPHPRGNPPGPDQPGRRSRSDLWPGRGPVLPRRLPECRATAGRCGAHRLRRGHGHRS